MRSNSLKQLEVLCIPSPDLEHDPGGISCSLQGLFDFVNVLLSQDLHGNDFDPVLAGQIKKPGQTIRSMPLEIIGTGPGLVGTHSGRYYPQTLQEFEGLLRMFKCVNSARSGKDMKGFLIKFYALICKTYWYES